MRVGLISTREIKTHRLDCEKTSRTSFVIGVVFVNARLYYTSVKKRRGRVFVIQGPKLNKQFICCLLIRNIPLSLFTYLTFPGYCSWDARDSWWPERKQSWLKTRPRVKYPRKNTYLAKFPWDRRRPGRTSWRWRQHLKQKENKWLVIIAKLALLVLCDGTWRRSIVLFVLPAHPETQSFQRSRAERQPWEQKSLPLGGYKGAGDCDDLRKVFGEFPIVLISTRAYRLSGHNLTLKPTSRGDLDTTPPVTGPEGSGQPKKFKAIETKAKETEGKKVLTLRLERSTEAAQPAADRN